MTEPDRTANPTEPPLLVVVVDTEEEFDWGGGFDRHARSVRAMAEIGRFQSLCDELGVRPVYVVDHPVASQAEAYEHLLGAATAGRCEIGAHLHPWVNPPFEEPVDAFHSYPGNLDPRLEARKCDVLAETIVASFGQRPVTYKAGRYGLGPHSHAMLEALGFQVDLSPAPGFDFSVDGGPDYLDASSRPRWFGARGDLLCLPCTGGFAGFLGERGGRAAWKLGAAGPLRALRWRGLLSRLGATRQIRLSPEGYGLEENIALTDALLDAGQRVFQFSFHSPSLLPGCTAYTRRPADVDALLATIRSYLEHFLARLGGQAVTAAEARRALLGARGGRAN